MAPSRLRTSLAYLNWLYNPFHGLGVSQVYDLLATTSPTEHGLYINLGYWPKAVSFDEASEGLAMLVGETAEMSGTDTILDCGFGFGDQDMLWARTLVPRHIIGLNITASQVAHARRRVSAAGMDDRIDLLPGSATDMPLGPNSVDKVVAVECAFHFRTREQFFREAWRVLRPGGRLVTADIIPMAPVEDPRARVKHWFSWRLVAGKFGIPKENAYGRATYRSKLEASGFAEIGVESIREQVYPPMHRYLTEHPETLQRLHPMARMPARLASRFDAEALYGGLDYVLAAAVKPPTAAASTE